MTDSRTPGVEPPVQHRAPLPPIRFADLAKALLDQASTLLPQWLPDGTLRGHEYVCAGLSGGRGTSCSVNVNTGQWADFATGEQGGDLLSLYAAIEGLTMGKAALQVARELGLEDVAGVQRGGSPAEPRPPRPTPPPSTPKPAADEGWATVAPVPDGALAPTFRHQYRPLADIEHTAAYSIDGALYGYVVRFRTSDGGKETLPYTWCQSARDGAAKWHWRQWDEPRPLYFPSGLTPNGRTVVLVEGEKKAGTLQALLDADAPGVYCVASWAGGCKAWKKADWQWLAGTTVLLWPDCDSKRVPLTPTERKATPFAAAQAALAAAKPLLAADKQPGMAAMLGIGALLRDAQGCTVSLLPIPEPGVVVDGWDCGDAITADGWDGARVLAFFGQAQPLPVPEAPATPSTDAPAENRERPVDTDTGGGGDGIKAHPWWLAPYWDGDKCRWLVSRKLVIAALTNDDALAGVLGLNLLSNNIEARRPWPWAHGKAGPITGAVDLMLGQYLSTTYGLPSINRAALMEGVETVAHQAPWHPVREYLQGLEFDGTSRIDKWLLHALGETPDSLPKTVVEYLRLVGRFILLGMVYRVMEPGCKWDYCPVLEGPGGLGKSTLVESLAGPGWFSDTHFDVSRGKEGQEQVQGLWVYEIAELANFGKAEIALIKAFITAKVDRYRPSYGRVVESYARQCVMFGTTNESTYLRDRTGNRRFWPIPVRHRINVPWVAKWRDQLLAEAYLIYTEGAPYTPTPAEEARLFVPMQESRLVETAVLSELLNVLTRDPVSHGIGAIVNNLADFVTMAQLVAALGVDAAKSSPALEGQIRSWMEHEGWERTKRQVNGVRAWGYAKPKGWPPLDMTEAPTFNTPAASPNPNPEAPGEAPPPAQDADDAPF
jgi:putative DNA primase/helicase